MAITPEFIQGQVAKNKPTTATVSWVRPTNFINKKQAFTAYERAKKDNYSWDFVKFVNGLEKKWWSVEESAQIKTAKAEAQFTEQKRQSAQKKVLRKIPISEATGSEIWNDLMNEMWEWAKTFLAPSVWALQWLSDIWQWIVWKPVEFLAKKFMWMFWFDDESLESLSTQSDISKWLNPTGAMIGKEVWKLAWSIALTPWWAVWWSLKALKWVKYMQEVAKRVAIWAWEWLVWNLAYNVASSDSVWTPVNLWVWAWIWAWFRFLPVIWNWLSAIAQKIPWIKNARASKLELSWIMNRTKLEYLQDTLRQWGADELAKGTPEDVAEWMFQRGLEWNKQTIMWKLDEIADASMDMLSKKLSKVEWVHDTGTLDDILKMLDTEYSDGISTVVKNKAKTIQSFMAKKAKEWGLTISEINEVKKMVYKDLNPYTATGKVKVSKEDVAFANREIKNFIEQVAERAWVTSDWMTIKLLNNEYAMADGMRKAIAQKDALDAVSTITNFISHSGSPLAIWGIAGANVWPFDKNTTEWMIWNIIVWAMIWKVASSTTVRTKVANWLRAMPEAEKAGIYKVLKKGSEIVESDKQVLLNSLQKLDVDVIDNASVSFLDEADIARLSNTSDNVIDWVPTTTPMATETAEQVVPTASLDDMLKNATDEELKARWMTATAIKKLRKKQSFNSVSPTTNAIQDISQQWDELLQTPSVVSKVDDALPTAWKMDETVTQTAKSLEPSDLTESIKKAKAEGKTFEEWVWSEKDDVLWLTWPEKIIEKTDKILNDLYKKRMFLLDNWWTKHPDRDVVTNKINKRRNELVLWMPLYDHKAQLRNERDKLDVPTTSAISKDIPKELIEEAKKYKSVEEFMERLKYFVTTKADTYNTKWLNAKKYADSLYKEWKINKNEIWLAERVMKWEINTKNYKQIREQANRK